MKVSSFSTMDFKPQHRVEAWSELIWSALLAMLVPRERLIAAHTDVSRFTLRRSSATTGLGRLICSYLSVLLHESPELDPDSERHLVDSAPELVQLAMSRQSVSRTNCRPVPGRLRQTRPHPGPDRTPRAIHRKQRGDAVPGRK